jgi:hypothetical protein
MIKKEVGKLAMGRKAGSIQVHSGQVIHGREDNGQVRK